ncbi:hypothetical protein, partial [Streptococcus salivarius]|uniref:hypothetical protein n=1 Tax=Streptococcus salivarius TaxID=1304 RepID=UPI001118520B
MFVAPVRAALLVWLYDSSLLSPCQQQNSRVPKLDGIVALLPRVSYGLATVGAQEFKQDFIGLGMGAFYIPLQIRGDVAQFFDGVVLSHD